MSIVCLVFPCSRCEWKEGLGSMESALEGEEGGRVGEMVGMCPRWRRWRRERRMGFGGAKKEHVGKIAETS